MAEIVFSTSTSIPRSLFAGISYLRKIRLNTENYTMKAQLFETPPWTYTWPQYNLYEVQRTSTRWCGVSRGK